LANTAQAKKRARQAEKHREHNASLRSMVRTYIKKVYQAVEVGDKKLAETSFLAAVPVIDRMSDKGLLHKNKAARHKSRLSNHIKKMSGTVEQTIAKAKTTKTAKTKAATKTKAAKSAE
jgi:small subunit ribosomal protein S20